MPRISTTNSDSETDCSSDGSDSEYEIKLKKNTITKIDYSLKKDDMRNIIFEKIDNKYSYGKYGPFKVTMMSKNGYINATKLCQLDKTRRFRDWKKNKSTRELIDNVSKVFGLDKDSLIITINHGGNQKLSGSYVHPELIIDIASWISIDFKFKVSKIVREKFSDDAKSKIRELIREHNNEKAGLEEKIDKLLNDNVELKDGVKTLKSDNVELKTNVKKLRKENKRLFSRKEEILEGTHTLCDNVVILTGNKKDKNHLLILKNNDEEESDSETDSDTDSDDDVKPAKKVIKSYAYTVLKVEKNNVNSTIKRIKLTYPDSKIILDITSPNSKTLWKNIKLKLKEKLDVKNSSFNLKVNYTQPDFIKDIRKIHDERLNHGLDSDED
jgi:hypothetical protein